MRPHRLAGVATAALGACAALRGSPAGAQAATTTAAGEWIRLDSNYPLNDRMRIRIADGLATLTFVPPTHAQGFEVGGRIWTGIRADGVVQVLGSDGNYYPGKLRFEGADVIHVQVDHSGPGHAQRWGRLGTVIIGDWVRVASGTQPGDRMRILVEESTATIRYLPEAAPRNLRVGAVFWRNVSPSRTASVVGADGQFKPVRFRLENQGQQLRVSGASLAGDEIWVRPGLVDSALARLDDAATPPPGAEAPGTAAPACASTARFGPATGVGWNWELGFANSDTAKAEDLGVLEYQAWPSARLSTVIVTDIKRSLLPGLPDNFARVWQRVAGTQRSVDRVNLSATEYDSAGLAARASGLRAHDIEVYTTPQGVRYAGVWVSNPEGVDWAVVHGLASEAFGADFDQRRAQGYRLTDVEGYATPQGMRFAGIWQRSCDGVWREVRNMGRESYLRRLDSLNAEGFRLVDFESYRTPGGQRYAGIWEKVTGVAWAVRTDRTLQQFLNYHREYTDQGFRLLDYESYETEAGVRYAGIWAENDERYRMAFKRIVDDSIEDYRTNHKIPGISVAIIRDGTLLYSRGFGWADSARNKRAHSGTVYMMASIAKAVAGTIAARLEARGEIDLTTRTSEHLTDLPQHHRHTLEQLLSKTGCVWHYQQGPEPEYRDYTWSLEALKQIWSAPLLSGCTPGGAYHYSTHGYTFVAAALEEVTGKHIGELVADEITGPGQLRSFQLSQTSGSDRSYRSSYQVSEPYYFDGSQSRLGQYENPMWKVFGGGLRVNAPDLARFGWLTLSGGYVSDSVRDNRLWRSLTPGLKYWSDTTTAAPGVGLGWVVGTTATSLGNSRIAEHGGYSATGSGTHLIVYRDQRLVIAILTNQGDSGNTGKAHPAEGLARRLGRIMLANP